MLKIKTLGIAVVFTFISIGLFGCGPATTTDNKPAANANTAKPADNKQADNTAKPADNKPADNKPADNKPADNKPVASGDKIGVPECDEFIEKYEACIMGKVPEAQRAALKSALDQSRQSWKTAAANPQAKGTLAASCKTMLDTTKQATQAYGCTW